MDDGLTEELNVFKVPLNAPQRPDTTGGGSGTAAPDSGAKPSINEVMDQLDDKDSAADVVPPKTVLPEPMTRLTPPDDHYFVDQLKNGVLVGHKSVQKSRIVFGRATDCDVILEHPSVSRYHAVLLWSPADDNRYQSGESKESFWYLVDCGSTHGTTCNKMPVMAGKLIKLIPNNNVFKFGASTRLFTLGTTNDNEDHSDDEDINETDVVSETEAAKDKKKADKPVDDGCQWGMSDDADTKGEVTADSHALQAVISAMKTGTTDGQTDNANAYTANPNKCVQQWFEREGYDLEYKCDTLHNKFRCTLELPIDGQWIPVEGSLMPKKKDAITDACLKGCQLLDKAKLLFPWQQQEAQELRRKHEEDMDFEVDDMIDETVKITHKRLKRNSESDDSGVIVDTFETLNKKWSELNEELRQLRIKLANIGLQLDEQRPDPSTQESGDSLDDYMAAIGKKKYGLTMSDKIEKSKVRLKINVLEKEQQKLEKLIKLAKPSVELSLPVPAIPVAFGGTTDSLNKTDIKSIDKISLKSDTIVDKQTTIETNVELKCETKVESKEDEIKRKTETIINELKSSSKPKTDTKAKRKLNSQSIVNAIEKEKQLEKTKQSKQTYDNDFVDWLPPMGQMGDGKTKLNDKFGY